jgi:hypothetical protein
MEQDYCMVRTMELHMAHKPVLHMQALLALVDAADD